MKLDMIGIVVENTNRSLEFYRKLGWKIPEVAIDENHVEITLDGKIRSRANLSAKDRVLNQSL